jgi:hypothetical protein
MIEHERATMIPQPLEPDPNLFVVAVFPERVVLMDRSCGAIPMGENE